MESVCSILSVEITCKPILTEAGHVPGKGAAIIRWAIHDGEKDAPQLLYAPVPAPIVAIDERIIKTVVYQGKALLAER